MAKVTAGALPPLLLLVLAAAACGASDPATSPTSASTSSSVVPVDSEEPAPAPVSSSVATSSRAPAPSTTVAEAPPPASATTAVATTSPVATAAELDIGRLHPSVETVVADWSTDWSRSSIDLGELQLGIPARDPRDAIPPLDDPVFETAPQAAQWLDDRAPGVLALVGGEARFYPLGILHRHEIVNDRIGGVPAAVTYCPLCNTALVFDRRVDGAEIRLGVSGLLRHSDLVMWDDRTVSLWQQATGEGIVGDYQGVSLTRLPSAIVSFGDFARSYPDGRSLSRDTGYGSGYETNPYVGYSSQPRPYGFFTGEPDPRFPALERVVGVSAGGEERAYPFSAISRTGAVNDAVGGEPVAVFWGGETADALDRGSIADSRTVGTGVAYLAEAEGRVLTFSKEQDGDLFRDAETGTVWNLLGQAVDGPLAGTSLRLADHRNEFWFAWAAFYPSGTVYEGP